MHFGYSFDLISPERKKKTTYMYKPNFSEKFMKPLTFDLISGLNEAFIYLYIVYSKQHVRGAVMDPLSICHHHYQHLQIAA